MLYLLNIRDEQLTDRQAEETAHYYLENIRGFCDFPCTYYIVKQEITDNFDNRIPEFVWVISGWNLDEHGDEVDIIGNACFLTEERASLELQVMKQNYLRTEWDISRWTIGALSWTDGFVRMVDGSAVN